MILIILEFSRALGEIADGPAELFDHEGVRIIAPVWPHLRARPEKYFVDGAPAFLDRPAPEKQPAPQLILRRRRSAVAVHLSARTPPHEIAALREAVFAYVDEHPKAWRYASIVHIDGFQPVWKAR